MHRDAAMYVLLGPNTVRSEIVCTAAGKTVFALFWSLSSKVFEIISKYFNERKSQVQRILAQKCFFFDSLKK